MNIDVLQYLRCPVCHQPLRSADPHDGARLLRCPRGHSFDVARQGYVNLSAGRSRHAGDSTEMVRAREAFLSGGHYDFLSTALGDAATAEAVRYDAARREVAGARPEPARRGADPARSAGTRPKLAVDAGAGTGRHLAAVLDAMPDALGLALDVSKPALRRAARVHPRAGAVLCDTWGRLPLADASVALLLNVFAPRNGPEFRRVLHPAGALLVVTPAPDHLREMVGRLKLLRVDPAKVDRVAGSLGARLARTGRTVLRHRLQLSRPDVRALVGMGPSAWHMDPDRLAEQVAALPEPFTATASVRLETYRWRR